MKHFPAECRKHRPRTGKPALLATDIAGDAAAVGSLRGLSTPYHLGHGLLDHAQFVIHAGDAEGAAAAVEEARGIAGHLRCQSLLDRAADLMPAAPGVPAQAV